MYPFTFSYFHLRNSIFTLSLWGVASIPKSVRGVAWYKRLKTPDLGAQLIYNTQFLGKMSHINIEEIKSMKDFIRSLTSANVHLLQEILSIPPAIVETTGTNVLNFLNALKFEVKEFNPSQFIQALETIQRPELIPLVRKIAWLNVGSAKAAYISTPFESFVTMLREEVDSTQWKLIIGTGLSDKVTSEIDFDTSFKRCIEEDLIKPDLEILCDVMIAIDRHDIVQNIQKYSNIFPAMHKDDFHNKLMNELEYDYKVDHESWICKLREYTIQQNENVHIHFDDEETTPLDSVYTPLTVVKEILSKMKASEETSLNEIAFLRTIYKKEKSLEVVDFISIISTQDTAKPKVLCLIGNPGCGKTFVCKYLALQYGNEKHTNFQYVISTQCRNEEWHTMEKFREEKEEKITSQFVREFLAKTLSLTAKWSMSLTKYLVKADGEGLLLILDGVDEFTKDVPFKSTLLYSLLQRRILTRATVLLTSRPGAWNEIREEHGQGLRVDSNFQVLGFSPTDRDSYFKNRINTEAKLNDTKELFFRHDEINQLSLVPVNASLFTSLFNATNNILSKTLTHLYNALILYIIRRQLSRMGLKRLTRVDRIAQFHPSILECIGCIGKEAYEGIFHRELSCREEDIAIQVDTSEYKTERLGLMRVQVKLLKLGHRVNVWTFAHLTLQEYMAAVHLSNNTWVMQCVMIRFIVSIEEMFAMYKMVVRFLCGLLCERAACLIPIICRNIIPDTKSLIGLPMVHQLGYDVNIIGLSSWEKLTRVYLLISTLIVETNSKLMEKYFLCFIDQLPEHVYFTFKFSISPNEWLCSLTSLNYICQTEIICMSASFVNPIRFNLVYIDTRHINQTQFNSLLQVIEIRSVKILALYFYKKNSTTVLSYTNLIKETKMKFGTKISIELVGCNFSDDTGVNLVPTSLRLDDTLFSNIYSQHLSNQLSELDYFFLYPSDSERFQRKHLDELFPALCKAKQLKGLHLYDFPVKFHDNLLRILPQFLELQEVGLDDYSLLIPLAHLSSLTYLQVGDVNSEDISIHVHLLNIIDKNSFSLRGIKLYALHTVGIDSWNIFLDCLQSCKSLVQLELENIVLSSDDVTHWESAMYQLKSVVELEFYNVTLYDTGILSICIGLSYHPAIRLLSLVYCDNTSASCKALSHLISTLSVLEFLEMTNLSKPELESIEELRRIAESYFIKHNFY